MPSLELTPFHLLLLLGAGVLSGLVNTLASSGSAVTLPLLLWFGLPPAVANGTNHIPIIAGSVTRIIAFHRAGTLDWRNGIRFAIPVAIGSLAGAFIATRISNQSVQGAVTVAVVAAFCMLLLKPKRWIEGVPDAALRFHPWQLGGFLLIGAWAGFIVLDSATYLLLMLTLGVGYDLIRANSQKALLMFAGIIPASIIFIASGEVNWTLALLLMGGSVIGSWIGARIAVQEWSKVWTYRLLCLVIGGEMIHLLAKQFLHL